MVMKDNKEFFELYGNKSIRNNCNCCLSTVSTFFSDSLNYSHRYKSFLYFVNSVRKFFHSRVELNPKNDVIKSVGEIEKNVYASSYYK